MEFLFENKTKYSEKLYNSFIKDYAKEYSKSDRFFVFYNVLFFSLCSYIAFNEKQIVLGICVLIGTILFLGYNIAKPYIKKKKNKKSDKVSGNFVNSYKFGQNYFEVNNPEGNAKVSYLKIYRVIETKDYFYIFLTKEDAFIVAKIGFTKGNVLDFSSFIQKKTRFKYRNRIKAYQKKHKFWN